MMKHYRLLLVSTLTLIAACQKEADVNAVGGAHSEEELVVLDVPSAVIGEQQPNPLAMDNVLKAFSRLEATTKDGITERDILATHKYIAFTPSNEDEWYALMDLDEERMLLSSYPLDYEVSDGIIVSDSRFVTNGYSYKWAYVPIDYDLTQVACPYIHYYDIFSPEDTKSTKTGKSFPPGLLDAIERESYALCGLELIIPTLATKANVTPSGRIRFYDSHYMSFRGVEGLSIRAVRGTHSEYGHCNWDGTFTISDTFSHSFRYEIHFSRTDFVIRKNNTTDEVILKYSDYFGPIYKDFNDSETKFYAVLSRAAIVYYYGNNLGLRRPPMKTDNTARLAFQAMLTNAPNGNGLFTVNGRKILSDRPIIQIYRDSSGTPFSNITNYATTIHELAHASHWRNNQTQFNNTEECVSESFAQGVQWLLTSEAYPGYSCDTEYWRKHYTGIIQDLIDGFGYKSSQGWAEYRTEITPGGVTVTYEQHPSEKSYYDNVTGFTPSQIEEAVRVSTSWSNFQSNLLSSYPNVAGSADVANTFSYWDSEY